MGHSLIWLKRLSYKQVSIGSNPIGPTKKHKWERIMILLLAVIFSAIVVYAFNKLYCILHDDKDCWDWPG